MKRRNADCGKIRRPIKRNKITEGMYGSTTILYLKFLILWAIVITADFMFMFRFEFLWPFWLLLRSVHDSFKYKGLAFSVLFVCIAITSDLVCLFFIPVHWLLFAASTYVWVQYVWHTDKGICLPTIILWMLFVYLEAGIRWKDSRHMPHLDLCRPFAAHCIGYPVVTLGFGFKSYVGYRMRQRKQREVAKENEFYMQLLQQALPQDETTSTNNLIAASCNNTDDIQQHHNINGGISNGQLLNGSIAVSQHLQNNNIEHNNHSNSNNSHQNSNNISTTGDIQLNGGHNHHTQTSSQNAIHNNNTSSSSTTNHHHHNNNLNNLNNISSSNRNAQTNSKLNNLSNNNLPTTSSTITTISSAATTIITTVQAQANGHIGNNNLNNGGFTVSNTNSKNNRRSMDKDKNTKYETKNSLTTSSSTNNNNYHEISSAINHKDSKENTNNNWDSTISTSNNNNNSNNSNNCIPSTITSSSTSSPVSSSITLNLSKENNKTTNNLNIYNGLNQTNGNSYNNTSGENKKSQSNGNVIQYEVEEVIEPPERIKGRRNRSKRENAFSKDNHQNNNNNNNNHNSSHHNHHNSHHHSKDSLGNSDTSSVSSTTSSSATATISNIASQIVTKICDTCFRLETEVKKYRTEISHMKQIENELRQKLDSNITTKSCLQAKQRECDDLDKRLHELTNTRQIDTMNLQNTERRLAEERRQRQSLEAQLNNEKKARKLAEEKATRPECSEACKQRKQQIDNELKQLRRELKLLEEAKQTAEQQGRKYEQELRMFEAEIRNREAQQGTEVLMSALAAMQDKNSTLEKNLSAETRVKLDLFSALGEAKRQLEIKDSVLRNKEEEVLDLKAKIAQLLAVMPTDSLCLPSCSTTGSSMLRINDTPPLQGPSSPMLTSLNTAHQQIMAANQVFRLTGSEIFQKDCENTNSGGNSGSVVSGNVNNQGITTGNGNSINNNNNNNNNGQNLSGGNNGGSSNLDPNATAYTPKNSSMVGGGSEA